MEIALTDGTWVEGEVTAPREMWDGIWLDKAHRSRDKKSGTIPLGKTVFVPYSNILFVIVEE